MAVRHLLLDLAGVLCGFDSAARLERLAAVSGLETAEVDERLYGSGIVDRCDRGELDAAGIRGVLREQLGLDCDDLELARLWASAFTADEQVLAVIDDVAPGVTRTLLTNNDALLRDALPLVLPAVHTRIAIPLFSATTRATKPSPTAYAAALTVLGAAPADVLFVDDSQGQRRRRPPDRHRHDPLHLGPVAALRAGQRGPARLTVFTAIAGYLHGGVLNGTPRGSRSCSEQPQCALHNDTGSHVALSSR